MDSRIVAVDHIHLESRPELVPDLLWFYGELAALDIVGGECLNPPLLRFRSARRELRFHLTERPAVDSLAARVTILVPSLDEIRLALEERAMTFQTLTGMSWTDVRVETLDPVGHRVAFKRGWPFAPL